MKRQIKYQVYNTADNEMYGDEVAKLILYNIAIDKEADKGKWVIREYTGLKDKNGKEIYEGDILRGKFGTGGGGMYTHYKDFNFYISYHCNETKAGFMINMPENYGRYRFHPYIPACEIIGNIYENNKLLQK